MTSPDELRRVDHEAVVAWKRHVHEVERSHPATIRRRLAALSSLFQHLIKNRLMSTNPVREVEQLAINRWAGMTPAFTSQQAHALNALNAEYGRRTVHVGGLGGGYRAWAMRQAFRSPQYTTN